MFGYIRFDKNELKLKEYRLLRAYYCGLCQRLGKIAPILKLKLSYDMTFLALCLACVSSETPVLKKTWCANHPMQKTGYAVSPSIDMAADLSVLLAVFKMKDDAMDGQKAKAFLASSILRKAYQKARFRNSNLHDCLKENLENFYQGEKNGCDAEELAVLFGETLKHMIPFFHMEEKYAPVMETLAANLGQWIYIADAADDREDDLKKGRFNPLKEKVSYYAPAQSFRLSQASAAAALLPDNAFKPIIENFMIYGMYAQQIKFFSDKEEQHETQSEKIKSKS